MLHLQDKICSTPVTLTFIQTVRGCFVVCASFVVICYFGKVQPQLQWKKRWPAVRTSFILWMAAKMLVTLVRESAAKKRRSPGQYWVEISGPDIFMIVTLTPITYHMFMAVVPQ